MLVEAELSKRYQTPGSSSRIGLRVISQTCNVASESDVDHTFDELMAKLAHDSHPQQPLISVVINNAGVVTGKPLLAASSADILRSFSVNGIHTHTHTRIEATH
jgi:NAD(P)-dependent dehydrogenase (short-subunit alcohol dehydrogenase family)